MSGKGEDRCNLERFLDAQDEVFEQVRRELKSGRKQTHWMWFIFPQIKGLGHSPIAQFYAINDLAEARAYLQHPVLGARLRMCTKDVNGLPSSSLEDIFGPVDSLKFRSCMTLFSRASPDNEEFTQALDKYCHGAQDPGTLARLGL